MGGIHLERLQSSLIYMSSPHPSADIGLAPSGDGGLRLPEHTDARQGPEEQLTAPSSWEGGGQYDGETHTPPLAKSTSEGFESHTNYFVCLFFCFYAFCLERLNHCVVKSCQGIFP